MKRIRLGLIALGLLILAPLLNQPMQMAWAAFMGQVAVCDIAAPTNCMTISGGALSSGGSVASGATDSGNPVKVGGVYNSTQPTFTTGQRGDLQIGSRGSLSVQIMNPDGTTGAATATVGGSDTQSNTVNVLQTRAYGAVWSAADAQWQRLPGSVAAGVVVKPFAPPTSDWNYAAAASGIVNTTTAVTIKTAAGGVLRNYITSCQIMSEALGAATELAIRDGAAGTVLWRTKIAAAGVTGGEDVTFPSPLKGTANTLTEIVTLTASVTGAVYVNCQGFTAA